MSLFQRLGLLVAAFASLACGLGAAPSAQRLHMAPDAPAQIVVTPVTERWDGEGFLPLRVRVENRAKEALGWELSFVVHLGYGGNSLRHEVRVEAGAGEAAETVVFVPGAGAVPSGQRASLSVSLSGPGALGYGGNFLHGNTDAVIPTATTATLEGPLLSATHGAPGVRSEITAVDPARWPADWRVWSPFKRVVLDDREYAALDAARRAALDDWVALGGTLDLYPSGSAPGAVAEPFRPHGHGAIRRMARTLAEEAASSAAKPEVVLARRSLEQLTAGEGRAISLERREQLQPGQGALGISLFLVAFGVFIGPINLFVFAPSGRRHRLFLTMPLISLAASALLAGYIVVKDGFGGEGARSGLVLLLPDSNQAVVTQTQIARTGVLLGDGFELAEDTTLARSGAVPTHWGHAYHGSSGEKTDSYARSGGRAAGDWFASRRLQEHTLRRLTPTRARVELVEGGDGERAPVVQSSVATVLRDFLYTDPSGRLWGAEELAPGLRVTLKRKSNLVTPDGLGRGTFTALGGAAEGLAPIETLSSIRWDEPKFVYAGTVVGARKP